MTFEDDSVDGFTRLHRIFTFHLGVASALAWMTALYAAMYAPWVRDIRALIEPGNLGRVESTGAFLFGFPIVLAVAWVVVFAGENILRHMGVMKNQAAEFGCAALVALIIFYLAIDRAVAAILLAS